VHEFGLCEAVLEAVERRAAGRPVARVKVRVGALQRVSAESFDQAFAFVSEGSVAHGAAIDLVTVPVVMACRSCGYRTESDDALAVCSSCGGTDLDLVGGDELTLESIELAVPA